MGMNHIKTLQIDFIIHRDMMYRAREMKCSFLIKIEHLAIISMLCHHFNQIMSYNAWPISY